MGKWYFWIMVIATNLTFPSMYFVGLADMPRRILEADYALQFTNFNMLATVGVFIFGFSQLIFLYNVIHTIKKGKCTTA